MRSVIPMLLGLALAAGCAGPRVPQPEVPPARLENGGRIAPDARTKTDDEATDRWLQQRTGEQARTTDKVRGRTPTDEEATQHWLEQEGERRTYVPPVPPPQRVVERVVVQTPQYGYDGYGYPEGYERRYATTPFPVYTTYGAGLGAAIGSASHHAGQGAAIGAGVGLVLDLVRWH